MAFPIKTDYNFKYVHKKKDNHFSMPSANVYGNAYGIGYMISGDRMIITPGRTIIVHPKTVQFMHKDLYHRTSYVAGDIYENIGIKFTEEVAEHVISIIGKEQFDYLYSQISFSLTSQACEEILRILSMIEREQENHDKYSNIIAENLIIQYFITVLRGITNASQTNSGFLSEDTPLRKALHYLEHSYMEDPSLKQTADAVHISDAHLSRLFTEELGTSYSHYLTERKLDHALQLLANTHLPITEVSIQSGFKNSNYFSEVFKKRFGISPLKYRGSVKDSSSTYPPAD